MKYNLLQMLRRDLRSYLPTAMVISWKINSIRICLILGHMSPVLRDSLCTFNLLSPHSQFFTSFWSFPRTNINQLVCVSNPAESGDLQGCNGFSLGFVTFRVVHPIQTKLGTNQGARKWFSERNVRRYFENISAVSPFSSRVGVTQYRQKNKYVSISFFKEGYICNFWQGLNVALSLPFTWPNLWALFFLPTGYINHSLPNTSHKLINILLFRSISASFLADLRQ